MVLARIEWVKRLRILLNSQSTRIQTIMKNIFNRLALLGVVLTVLLGACTNNTSKVVIGNVEDWTVNNSLTYLTKAVLEEKGIKVEVNNQKIESIFRQMEEQKIDLYMDAWEDAHYVYIYEHEGLEDLDEVYTGCKMGIAVPSYFEVDSLSQLKNDSTLHNDMFYGVEKDAGVMISAVTAFKNYKMDPQIINMEEDKFLKQLELMVSKKENFAAAAWKPHWKNAAFDLKFIADTSASFGASDEIHAYSRPNFKSDNPKVAAIISKIFLTDTQMTSLLLKVKDATNAQEYQHAVSAWITENRAAVDAWLQ